MVNIEKQIAYWRTGARDDWESAQILIERGKIRLVFLLYIWRWKRR